MKGYDRLIRCAIRLHNEGFSFRLVILGKGPEEAAYRKLIEENSAEDYIKLLGFRENPYQIMKHASFFVSSSRSEGMASVLIEALTLGLPVISTDVSGAREVLGCNNEFGLVVDNSEEGIDCGVRAFLQNSRLLEHYHTFAADRAERFGSERTVSEVEALLQEIRR